MINLTEDEAKSFMKNGGRLISRRKDEAYWNGFIFVLDLFIGGKLSNESVVFDWKYLNTFSKKEVEDPEITLEIKGFKTIAQAKAFIDWYEGQTDLSARSREAEEGEQDASIWFECRQEEGKIDVDFMPVDCSKQYVITEDKVTAWLKIP